MSNRHGAMPRQKGENFSVIFVPDYLVVPNNLLTHIRTVAQITLLRARETRRTPYQQRARKGSLCSLFRALLPSHARGK